MNECDCNVNNDCECTVNELPILRLSMSDVKNMSMCDPPPPQNLPCNPSHSSSVPKPFLSFQLTTPPNPSPAISCVPSFSADESTPIPPFLLPASILLPFPPWLSFDSTPTPPITPPGMFPGLPPTPISPTDPNSMPPTPITALKTLSIPPMPLKTSSTPPMSFWLFFKNSSKTCCVLSIKSEDESWKCEQ